MSLIVSSWTTSSPIVSYCLLLSPNGQHHLSSSPIVSYCLLMDNIVSHHLLSSPIGQHSVELSIMSITSCIVTCSSPDRSSCCVAVFKDGFRYNLKFLKTI